METESALFFTLVYQYNELAMMQLGKIPGPDGKIASVNIEGAKYAIDLLEMIGRKTAGNLTDEENRFLQQTLTNLRLNFLDENQRLSQTTNQA